MYNIEWVGLSGVHWIPVHSVALFTGVLAVAPGSTIPFCLQSFPHFGFFTFVNPVFHCGLLHGNEHVWDCIFAQSTNDYQYYMRCEHVERARGSATSFRIVSLKLQVWNLPKKARRISYYLVGYFPILLILYKFSW